MDYDTRDNVDCSVSNKGAPLSCYLLGSHLPVGHDTRWILMLQRVG